MSQSARVLSTDALRDFQAGLAKFSAKGREALRLALMEIRHVLDWLEAQLITWRREAEKRREEVNRCRAELAVARSAPESWRSAVSEREIDLRRAQMRFREAEAKAEAARRWQRTLPQILNEYEQPMRRLGGFLDGDVHHALAVLGDKIEALNAYMALEAPAGAAPPSTAPAAAPATTPEKQP